MSELRKKEIRELILATVDDMIADLLYYDRKEDEDLPRGMIEKSIKNGYVSVEDIVNQFKTSLIKGIKQN